MNPTPDTTPRWGMLQLDGERAPRAAMVAEATFCGRPVLSVRYLQRGELAPEELLPAERLRLLRVLDEAATRALSQPAPEADDVIEFVVELTGVPRHRVLGRERTAEVATARFLVMAGCMRLGYTQAATARLLGRDHGCIDSGLKRLRELATQNQRVAAWIQTIHRRWAPPATTTP